MGIFLGFMEISAVGSPGRISASFSNSVSRKLLIYLTTSTYEFRMAADKRILSRVFLLVSQGCFATLF